MTDKRTAGIGDLALAAEFLRPQGGDQVELIRSRFPDRDMEISVYGYWPSERARVVDGILQLRGSNNLVFANSRGDVEHYTALLRRCPEMAGVADEFVPRHARISKRSREITEAKLKAQSQPVTAVCTSTLELGIDLGELKEVAQIGPPRSVGSAMQRLGRSGRRGNTAILKLHIIEPEITPATTVSGALHEDLIQTIAIMDLGLAGWCEAAPAWRAASVDACATDPFGSRSDRWHQCRTDVANRYRGNAEADQPGRPSNRAWNAGAYEQRRHMIAPKP